tara:strand:- start:434 stop:616 length:183 start_codon:yes stop_codon:yes gene_type:complete
MMIIKEKILNCMPTIMLNVNAVMVSLVEVEAMFRIVSYLVAIIWTSLQIYKMLKDGNNKR